MGKAHSPMSMEPIFPHEPIFWSSYQVACEIAETVARHMNHYKNTNKNYLGQVRRIPIVASRDQPDFPFRPIKFES